MYVFVGPPIIMIAWEGCFGRLAVVSACKCSHLIEGLDYSGAREEVVCISKPNEGFYSQVS